MVALAVDAVWGVWAVLPCGCGVFGTLGASRPVLGGVVSATANSTSWLGLAALGRVTQRLAPGALCKCWAHWRHRESELVGKEPDPGLLEEPRACLAALIYKGE